MLGPAMPTEPGKATSSAKEVPIAQRAFFTLLVILACACGPKPTSEPLGRGILVIAIDALRADHIRSAGYDRPTTPVLDALAGQGTTFLQAWSTSPDLLAAHASLLTGCDPNLAHRAAYSDADTDASLTSWYIPEGVPRLAQEFLSHGYATAAFVDHPAIAPVFGFGAGFQDFYAFAGESIEPRATVREYNFENLAEKFRQWLFDHSPSQDWFAYIHVNDLERLWERPQPDPDWDTRFEPRPEMSEVPPVAEADRIFFAIPRSRWARGTLSLGEYEARYDGALCQLDQKLGRLLERLRQTNRLKSTTVVVAGTYGISFGESGLILDSGSLSDADLHVPLMIRPPLTMNCVRGAKCGELVSLVDVAPTLLDLSQIPIPAGMRGYGVSHLPALQGREESARTYAFASGGLQAGYAVFDGRWCYERSSPGTSHPSAIAASWYGDDGDHENEYRTFLHDRESVHAKGHLFGGSSDPAVEGRMRAAGEEWFGWVTRAQAVLQGTGADGGSADPATLEGLRKRGLIGEPR